MSTSTAREVTILKDSLQKELLKSSSGKKTANDEQLLDLLSRLEEIPMTLEILTATLIGAVVAKLKLQDGPVGAKARVLVKGWKQIAKGETVSNDSTATTGDNSSTNKTRRDSSTQQESLDSSYRPEIEWSDLSPNRQSMCEKFYQLLLHAKDDIINAGVNPEAIQKLAATPAVEIELAIFREFHDKKSYSDKARSIAFNLKKNRQLCTDICFGHVQADELIKMKPEELASAEQQRIRAEQAKKLIDSKRLDWDQANEDKINKMCGIKGDLLKASLFTCKRCKSIKTTSTQKQTRSADEPMTVFVLCLNCGNRWKC